jgi:tRNA U34 5-methylaminomethyl-2-thiouridine-forming methyltransferase MnmC
LKREILKTLDGSTTIHLPDWNESYHSKYGAIQEAYHVFIQNGLNTFNSQPVCILEIGFGTGLNAFITYLESKKSNQKIDYYGVEAYPISSEEIFQMNYVSELNVVSESEVFKLIHECEWEINNKISTLFSLTKRKQFIEQINDHDKFDLIYFDAFGYRVQPELWSTDIFRKMYKSLKSKGTLVTYAAKGVVKRSLIEVGFKVEKLPGPPGKREMFRATKSDL